MSQPGENSKIFIKSGEKNVRWCDIRCSIMNTQQHLKGELKRVLCFPCKLILQKLALVRRLTANGSKGTATSWKAYSLLILAEEDMKRKEDEMNAL